MHNTPQHNGIMESLNWRLLEQVRAIPHHSGLPKMLWAKALHFAVWLKNHTSTRALGNNTTPLKKLTGIKPNLSNVPEWGQTVWVHSSTRSKLNACGVEAHWVGYDLNSPHAYHIYWLHKNSVSVERNIRFMSPTFTFYPTVSGGQCTTVAQLTAALAPPSVPLAPPTLVVPQPLHGPSPKVPGAMPPATPQLPIGVLPLPPAPLTSAPQVQPQPPPTTESGEEEMLE